MLNKVGVFIMREIKHTQENISTQRTRAGSEMEAGLPGKEHDSHPTMAKVLRI